MKRCLRTSSATFSAERTLIATKRFSRVSRAFQTEPMPPLPSGPRISYGPRRVPAHGVIAVSTMLYQRYSPDSGPAQCGVDVVIKSLAFGRRLEELWFQ